MNFTILFNVFALFFATLFALGSAAPLQARDVYVPPITYPHAGTVWKIGNHHNVTWDVSNPPQNITNSIGFIELVTNGRITGPTLASNFSILLGRIEVQVPDVKPGPYQLVLFGDSGNDSPIFHITK
ncbi:hypothetical protein EWM64_g2576 [Hericium alpestre]|uniref:Uncharacterized protein n=1 Tax=Hericium alpestre TaxID=135208 RepID=A0A4Z0A532_9AGAM|nr:hypothetical protein EWM64_g2576 [Hericium alpestre]